MSRAKRRKDGRFKTSFRFNGERIQVYARNQKDLPEKVAQKKKELEEGEKARANPTLDRFYETFTERRRGRVAESTIRTQRIQYEALRNIPVMQGKPLGKMLVRNITPYDIETIQKALQHRTGRPLTTQSINNYIDHLKHVFNEAVKLDIIDKNPCRTIYSLARTEKPARDTIHRALTKEEIAAFIEGAEERNSYYLPLFVFMLNTGVRVGEAGAITEDEIEGNRVHIVRTIAKTEIGGYHFQKPKTEAGKRVIPLNLDARKAIYAQRENLTMLRLDNRPAKIVSGNEDTATHPRKATLFCSPEGKLLRDYAVDREIKRICKAKGIKRFTSHAMRDTFATLYTENNPTDWKTLQKILGHTDAETTLNIYIHAVDSRVEETMKNFSIRA